MKHFARLLLPFLLPLCLAGCSGKLTFSSKTTSSPCDQNSTLFSEGTTYQVDSKGSITQIGGPISIPVVQFTNSATSTILKPTLYAGVQASDIHTVGTMTETLANLDGSSIDATNSSTGDIYQVLGADNLTTYGSAGVLSSQVGSNPALISTSHSSYAPATTVPSTPILGTTYGPEKYAATLIVSLNGGSPTTNVDDEVVSRTYSSETITVAAGTFLACKQSMTSSATDTTLGDSTSHGTSEVWVVGSGACKGMELKRTSDETVTRSGTSLEEQTSEEAVSLTLNGTSCTP